MITAGNAPGLNDGGAALVVMSGERVKATGARPLARVTGYATGGGEPKELFFAPIVAVEKLMKQMGVGIGHFDLIEANEAFAAQALADGNGLGWDWDRVNVNGGAVALGHPIGASGARVLVTLLYALQDAQTQDRTRDALSRRWQRRGARSGESVMSTQTEVVTSGPSAAVKKVMVVGGGTMGNGIAQVFATCGFEVELVDARPDLVERALGAVGKSLERVAKKQEWPADKAPAILKRIHGGTSLEVARDADLVIEAVTEDFAVKRQIFQTLDGVAPARCILGSNTSSISITEIAAVTRRPEQVIGMHFMNPVPVMQLVEIIRGLTTSDATYALTEDLSRRLGKTPVEVNDYPGFISNRILMPMINEAVFTLMEGVATREAIDTVMKLGMNHPMGPLALADLIGLDTCLSIMEVLHEGLGDSKYRPCPLLRKMVKAGHLGRKSGRGFFDYREAPKA